MRGKPLKGCKPEKDGIAEILESRSAPNFIVRGSERGLPEHAKVPVDPRFSGGRGAEELERDYADVIAKKKAVAARERRARGTSRARKGLHYKGSVPLHQWAALRNLHGKEAMDDPEARGAILRENRLIED